MAFSAEPLRSLAGRGLEPYRGHLSKDAENGWVRGVDQPIRGWFSALRCWFEIRVDALAGGEMLGDSVCCWSANQKRALTKKPRCPMGLGFTATDPEMLKGEGDVWIPRALWCLFSMDSPRFHWNQFFPCGLGGKATWQCSGCSQVLCAELGDGHSTVFQAGLQLRFQTF